MTGREELVWEGDGPLLLNRPVMVLALTGLFDIAQVATKAIEHLVSTHNVETVATIDCDGFYDFQQERPTVWLDEYGDRQISWPSNEFHAIRYPGLPHDLIVMSGVEPHVRWRTFAELVLEVARRTGCEVIVTIGMGIAFLNESLTGRQVLGTVCILGGVAVLARAESRREAGMSPQVP